MTRIKGFCCQVNAKDAGKEGLGCWRLGGDWMPVDWEVANLVLARWVRGWWRGSFQGGGARIIEVYAGFYTGTGPGEWEWSGGAGVCVVSAGGEGAEAGELRGVSAGSGAVCRAC